MCYLQNKLVISPHDYFSVKTYMKTLIKNLMISNHINT